MSADCNPGSRTWHRALDTTFAEEPTIYPSDVEPGCSGTGWFCHHEESPIPAGYGLSPEEAYVDYVEEVWCVFNTFPKGYPA